MSKMDKKVKSFAKRFFGDRIIAKIIPYKIFFVNRKNRSLLKCNDVESVDVFYERKQNVFCGYYDVDPESNKRILVHMVPTNAKRGSSISLGFFHLPDYKFTEIAKTSAWSWQQGSRLRWSVSESNTVFYNTVSGKKYVTVKKDLDSEKQITYCCALYDISRDEQYGASINFDRLQRLRPGYGYSCFEDKTMDSKAPDDDGLFIVNLNTNKKELVVSLRELADDIDGDSNYNHYLNHISFSPDSSKIMFFHLWDEKKGRFNWQNRLYIYDLEKGQKRLIESKVVVSHYVWVSNSELLITCGTQDGEEYRLYNVDSCSFSIVNDRHLRRDGHPVMLGKKKFCSDTYPDKECLQHLFLYNITSNRYNEIATMYSNPFLVGEKRCDLHPKYNKESNSILVDSTYSGRQRSIIRLELKK